MLDENASVKRMIDYMQQHKENKTYWFMQRGENWMLSSTQKTRNGMVVRVLIL